MKFTEEIFNIELEMADLSKTGNAGEYNTHDKKIYIDYDYIRSLIPDDNYFSKELKRIVVHELTHFFDFNCWKSWSYKEDSPHEHLATFNETFHEYTEIFANRMCEWMLSKDKNFKAKKTIKK